MSTAWYSAEVQKQMESAGTSTDEIKVDLRLSVLKPLQATWLVSLYDQLTGSMGKRHIAKGWSIAEISELVQGKTWRSIGKHISDHYLKANWQRHRVK